MEPKPPGWSMTYGAAFGDTEVVRVYHVRPPYPDETITEVIRLAPGGAILDAGCGIGELARRLAPHVERVDAVDVSEPMLSVARRSAGGGRRNLRWLQGAVEDATFDPPYDMIVAGDSIHWFGWPQAVNRFAELLGDAGVLAIVHREWHLDEDALERLRPVFARHSWNPDFAPLEPVEELERRGLFVPLGEHVSRPVRWTPTLDEIVDVHFSTSGCARSRIPHPEAFARELREAVATSLSEVDGRYELEVVGTIVWGRPVAPKTREGRRFRRVVSDLKSDTDPWTESRRPVGPESAGARVTIEAQVSDSKSDTEDGKQVADRKSDTETAVDVGPRQRNDEGPARAGPSFP
jgi:SAM-dependent methyltransferase